MPHLTEVPLQAVALEAAEFSIKEMDQVTKEVILHRKAIPEALTKVAHAEAAVAEALVKLVLKMEIQADLQEEMEQHLQ